MEIQQIIKLMKQEKVDRLKLLSTINQYFTEKYNVPLCKLEIVEPEENEELGYKPVAEFWSKNTPKKLLDFGIRLNPEVFKTGKISRIIKLFCHEWGHYYTKLAKYNIVKQENVDKRYKDLILKSFSYSLKKDSEKYKNKEVLRALNKLSALEMVADNFAIDFLDELVDNCDVEYINNGLRKQQEQHRQQVAECEALIKNSNL